MRTSRTIARFVGAVPSSHGERTGAVLRFDPLTGRLGTDRIEEWVELGPDRSVEATVGIGKVLRILRVARVAIAGSVEDLVEDPEHLFELLERAQGTELRLILRRRSRLHFLVWTEEGLERVEDVSEVEETDDAYVARPRGARFPRRFPRESVIRQKTETERWLEIVEILRPE